MDYHVEKDLVICSNKLIPFIKTYCRTGFYVSIPFTANEYYVALLPPLPKDLPKEEKEKLKGVYVVYKVSLTEDTVFQYVDDRELARVKRTLKEASDLFKENKNSECTVLGEMGRELWIKDVKSLDKETVERLEEVRQEYDGKNKPYTKLPEDIKPYVNLIKRPNLTVYPDAEYVKPEPGKIVGIFRTYNRKCVLLKNDAFEELTVPIAPPFNNKLYETVASAEILNRCSNTSITEHVECYLKYKVSRRVRYG